MGECPNEDCKDKLEETHDSVFKDAKGGCRYDITQLKLAMKDLCSSIDKACRKFIPRKTVWVIMIVFGIPGIIAFTNIWAGDKFSKDRFVSKGEFSAQVGEIIKLKEQVIYVCKEIDELKNQQKADTIRIIEAIENIKK